MSDDAKITAYLFTVEIDGIETARFQKCEGLESETYVYEIEEGGLNTTTHKFYMQLKEQKLPTKDFLLTGTKIIGVENGIRKGSDNKC